MHSSIVISALFAAGVFASPIMPKRALVTEVDVVTVTDWVYANGEPVSTAQAVEVSSTTTPVPETTTTTHSRNHHHHHSSAMPPPPAAPTTTAEAPVVIPAAPSSTSTPEAMAVLPSSTKAPVPVTPSPTPTPTPTPVPSPAPSPAPAATPAANNPSGSAPLTLVPNLSVTNPTYKAIALDHHNVHRANHSADAVAYNQTLAQWAQAKAESCVWNEDMPAGASGVGMNIAQGTYLGAGNLSMVISDMWYNSELANFPQYDVGSLDTSGKAFQGWGHFSQVVWKDTTAIGCGSAKCDPGTSIGSGYFVACMYYPPGNFLGEFTKVGRPKGNPTVAVVDNKIVGM